MRRFVFLTVFMLAGAFSGIFNTHAQPAYGLRISGGWANVSVTGPDASLFNTKPTGYFSAGVFAEYPLPKENLYFEPALMLSRKGFNWNFFYDFHFAFYYLEAPLMFTYHYENFTFGAGPYLALGLTGNLKYTEIDEDGNRVLKNEKYHPVLGQAKDDDKLYFNMLDFGIHLGVSYQIDRYRLGFYYSRGLAPVNGPYLEDDDDKLFNKVYYLSASYYFNF